LHFDDISDSGSGTFIGDYHGLGWDNWAVWNAIHFTNVFGVNGTYYGMVSASNVAGNAFGPAAQITAVGTNFSFLSAYLTGAFNSNLSIRVQGYRDNVLVYDQTKVVAATYSTLCTFDYLDVDRLVFGSSGGQSVFGSGPGGQNYFIMDDFMFEYIPEPSSLLLTALGLVPLWAYLKRRRA
jgi:hypothetical protein